MSERKEPAKIVDYAYQMSHIAAYCVADHGTEAGFLQVYNENPGQEYLNPKMVQKQKLERQAARQALVEHNQAGFRGHLWILLFRIGKARRRGPSAT